MFLPLSGRLADAVVSADSLRRVIVPPVPPMTDGEFQSQLGRHAGFLDSLKSPAQKRKTSRHPDIARAVATVEAAFRTAHDAMGTNDAEIYHRALVAVRQAIGAWGTVDAQHGEVTWQPAGN